MHAQITASNSTFSKLNNNQYTYNNSKQPIGDYKKNKNMKNEKCTRAPLLLVFISDPYLTCIAI